MKCVTYILNGIAVTLIFGVALCADGLMETYGPVGFLLRSLLCIGFAGICILGSNRLEEWQKENRPVYRKYTGRRDKRKHSPTYKPYYKGNERKNQDA